MCQHGIFRAHTSLYENVRSYIRETFTEGFGGTACLVVCMLALEWFVISLVVVPFFAEVVHFVWWFMTLQ